MSGNGGFAQNFVELLYSNGFFVDIQSQKKTSELLKFLKNSSFGVIFSWESWGLLHSKIFFTHFSSLTSAFFSQNSPKDVSLFFKILWNKIQNKTWTWKFLGEKWIILSKSCISNHKFCLLDNFQSKASTKLVRVS